MRNKIIINILIIYFFILSLVLVIQISSKKINATEPLSTEFSTEDKLKNSVVLYIDSPIGLVNNKQILIDKSDSTTTPIIEESKIYIPIVLLSTAFNANIDFLPHKKETTVRLNNKAIIFHNDTKKIKIIDNISEEEIEIESSSKIINDRFYIPIRAFAKIFEKEIFVYNKLIIISNMEDIFDPTEEIQTINDISEKVNFLPIVSNEENLKKILYNFQNKSNNIKRNNFLIKEDSTADDLQNLTENTERLSSVENNKKFIKSVENYNFYANNQILEIFYKDDKTNTEQFLFSIELYNNQLVDIILLENILILTYSSLDLSNQQKYTRVINYDISNINSVQKISEFYDNGEFKQNILNGDFLYTITKLDAKNKILPFFEKKYYEKDYFINHFDESPSLEQVYYFPDVNDEKYTNIIINNIKDVSERFNYNVFLGMGDNTILNQDNLYVSTFKNGKTNVYLFKLTLGKFEYLNRVNLDGKILNINNSVEFKEDIVTFKTDKEQKTYTLDLKIID